MRRKIGAVKYLECSAKTGEGVRELVEWAVRYSIGQGTDTKGELPMPTEKLSTRGSGVLRRLLRFAPKYPTE